MFSLINSTKLHKPYVINVTIQIILPINVLTRQNKSTRLIELETIPSLKRKTLDGDITPTSRGVKTHRIRIPLGLLFNPFKTTMRVNLFNQTSFNKILRNHLLINLNSCPKTINAYPLLKKVLNLWRKLQLKIFNQTITYKTC